MFAIAKTFHFSAEHHLTGLAEGHKCANRHGHNFTVTLVFRNLVLNGHGFVIDYGDLAVVKRWIDDRFDHDSLNRHLAQPSGEHLAELIHRRWDGEFDAELHTVIVQETGKTMAAYSPHRNPLLWSGAGG